MIRFPACVLLTASLGAQTVHVVGPGGFPQISHAIAVAAPGDVVEVTGGPYLPFTLDKGLVIRARPGQRVAIQTPGYDATRLRPPAGSVAVISGLEFRNAPFVYWGAETRVERGTVFCEECLFEAPPSYGNGALMVVNATAVLRRCILVGNAVGTGRAGTYNAGLLVQNAQAFASDCWLRGSDTTFDSYGAGGEGARLSASLAHFVRCVIEGGTQRGCLANPPGAGIRTTGATTLWLADCVVQGGTAACGAGATGLQHGGTTAAQLARCTIAGGPGSVSNGVAITGPTANAPLLGLGADTEPLVRGAAFTVAYRTQPNWPIAVFAATELAVRSEPLLAEPAHLAGTPCLLAIVVADAAGDAIFQTIVPLLPAAPHARFFVEGVAGLAPPFETAPPLGGVLH